MSTIDNKGTGLAAWLAASLAGLSVAACQSVGHLPGVLSGPPEASSQAAVQREARSYGQLTMTIRWPRRGVQYIPAETTSLRFQVFVDGNTTPYATRNVSSPGVGGTSTVSFEALPTGEVTLVGSALDGTGKVVAAGSSQITILPQRLVRGALTLSSTTAPSITTFYPHAADPGSEVTLFGLNFGDEPGRNATYSVWVGGLLAPGATRLDGGTLRFTVPENATNSVITLQVDALATRSAQVFTTIRAWTLWPSSAEVFAPYGTQAFHATARDHAGTVVPEPPFNSWSVVTVEGAEGATVTLEQDDEDGSAEDLDAEFQAPEGIGTYQVRVGKGSAARTATVTSHAMTFNDVSDRLGILPGAASPADNPTTPQKVALGKQLFFDPGIGSNGAMSCATCHLPDKGWGDGLKVSVGNDGLPLDRNSPSILNTGLAGRGPFFWDGRANSLEDQAKRVFGTARELNRTGDELLAYLNGAGYPASFSAVFGAAPTNGSEAMDQVTKTIAAFERTIVTEKSAFDRWAEGDESALGPAERRGLGVFATRGRCIECHNGPMFSDEQFHNISVIDGFAVSPGRQAITGDPGDLGRFKTPSLRNVTETAPYFHNGSVGTLMEAILHYEGEFEDTPNIDPLMAEPVTISVADREDLMAFLKALSGATPSVTP